MNITSTSTIVIALASVGISFASDVTTQTLTMKGTGVACQDPNWSVRVSGDHTLNTKQMAGSASGLPVVATDVEGIAELLGPVSDAQIAALGSASAFVDKVAAIAQDPHKSAELGHQNHRTVEQRFTLRGMIERYERLYESLIAP